jgi:hypothetical protein
MAEDLRQICGDALLRYLGLGHTLGGARNRNRLIKI